MSPDADTAAALELVELDSCDSTQSRVRALLATRGAGASVAVSARTQHAGSGRGARVWQNPTGASLMISYGRRGPLPIGVLDQLPLRIVEAVLDALGEQIPTIRTHVRWNAPNDLLDAELGAKVAGVLVDARTTAAVVDEVIVGIGINLDASPFVTDDGQSASSIRAACCTTVDRAGLLAALLDRLDQLLR